MAQTADVNDRSHSGAERVEHEAAETLAAPAGGHPRFPEIDSLRLIAVLGVFAAHVWEVPGDYSRAWWGDFANHARAGVTLFFVISGFLLFRPFVAAAAGRARRPRLGAYGVKRALRILPAFWVALTVTWIYPGLVMGSDWPIYYGLAQSLSDGRQFGGLTQAWSLSVEATFYLALPLAVLLAARLARGRSPEYAVRAHAAVAIAALVASYGFRLIYDGPRFGGAELTLVGLGGWFAAGMLIATASVQDELRPSRLAAAVRGRPEVLWLLALVALLLIGATDVTRNATWRSAEGTFVAYGLIAVAVALPACFAGDRRGPVRTLLEDPRLRWLGLVSYGIFLWHHAALRALDGHVALVVLIPVALVISVALAAASWYAIERPALHLKTRVDRAAG